MTGVQTCALPIFRMIGTVDGNGNTNSTHNYKFIDRYSDGKEAFYKLLQTDFDGRETTYGPIRAFACNGNITFSAQAFQTSASELSVLIKNPETGRVTISILSTEGKIVARKVVELEAGLNITTFDTAPLATGIYFVNIAGPDKMETVKVSITGFN